MPGFEASTSADTEKMLDEQGEGKKRLAAG